MIRTVVFAMLCATALWADPLTFKDGDSCDKLTTRKLEGKGLPISTGLMHACMNTIGEAKAVLVRDGNCYVIDPFDADAIRHFPILPNDIFFRYRGDSDLAGWKSPFLHDEKALKS